MPPAMYKSGDPSYFNIGLNVDLASGGTTLEVDRQHGLDGYIYETGVNEVYIVLNTESANEQSSTTVMRLYKVVESDQRRK